MRAELIGYLTEIASTLPGSDPAYADFDIDEVVHFFFDDTDLNDAQKSVDGDVLFDETERDAVLNVTSTIDSLVSQLGDSSSKVFLAHPAWETVRRNAIDALQLISKRGMPVVQG